MSVTDVDTSDAVGYFDHVIGFTYFCGASVVYTLSLSLNFLSGEIMLLLLVYSWLPVLLCFSCFNVVCF